MEFISVIEQRRSVRQFKDTPVEDETLRELIRLAALAPSPNNAQPWRFIAIADKALLGQMKDAVAAEIAKLPWGDADEAQQKRKKVEHFTTFFVDAPVVVAVLLKPYPTVIQEALTPESLTPEAINVMRGQPDVQSVGAATQNLLLAAVDKGLAGCWLSAPLVAREALEGLLGAEAPWTLTTMVALGEPAATPKGADKKGLDDLLEIRR